MSVPNLGMKVCETCGVSYQPTSGRQQFCSPRCRFGVHACEECSVEFVPNHGGQQFCSIRCSARASSPMLAGKFKGRAHPRFRGGIYKNNGHGRWVIECRDGSKMYYARGVMAAHLGRLLRSDEIVHHINGDRTDDRIANLAVLSQSEHIRLHYPEIMAGRGIAA